MRSQAMQLVGWTLGWVCSAACASAAPPPPAPPPTSAPPPTEPAPADPLGGFPLPAGAELFGETQATLSYVTTLAPREVLAFYTEALAGRFALEPIANGLALKGDAPFVYVSLSAYGDRTLLMLTRNVLHDAPLMPLPSTVFGAPLPTGVTLFSRTTEVFVAHSRRPIAEVCEWYDHQLPPSATRTHDFRDPRQSSPYCMFSAEAATRPPHGWSVVSVIPDHTLPGVLMISVVAGP